MYVMPLNQQRQILERRLRAERRKATTEFARSLYTDINTHVDTLSGIDRRAAQQLLDNNQFVND